MRDQERFARIIEGTPRKRPKTFLIVLALLVLLALVFSGRLMELYANWLWFQHDAQQPMVFQRELATRAGLWVSAFVLSFGAILLSLRLALRVRVGPARGSGAPEQEAALRGLEAFERFGGLLALGIAVVVGLGMAGGASGLYMRLWMFQSAGKFGIVDPVFSQDLGFYVFQLPWFTAVAGFLFGLSVVVLLLTGLAYLGMVALASAARTPLDQAPGRAHLSLLLGVVLVALGARMAFVRFDLLTAQGEQFAGPGYAQTQAMGLYGVLAFALMGLGVLTALNGWLFKPWRVPVYGGAAVLLFAVVALGILPGIWQSVKVNPNKNTVESPFARKAITATRQAYGLDSFNVKDFSVRPEPTPAELAAAEPTLDAMRLWDPDILRDSLNALQTLRPYYAMYDVDIDRYTIDGVRHMAMIAPRDIMVDGLQPNARSWVNQRMVYTHGFGAVMAPVNRSTRSGQPTTLLRDIPPSANPGVPNPKQPRLYFSNYPPGTQEHEFPVLVGATQQEFDYPTEAADTYYRWTGTRGVPIGSFGRRFLFATLLGENNLLFSREITANTRLVMRRDVSDRARRVYPFLRLDTDPYLVLTPERKYWVIDAYTATNAIPYSAALEGPLGRLNYLRNSVKVVVDAYSGDMNAYAFQEDEPILAAMRRTFPGLIKPRAEFPAELLPHIRYGEDGLLYQATVLQQYHVTDPQRFMLNNSAWQIATERGRGGSAERILPYYVLMQMPGEKQESFVLILPFTPNGKPNLIGWLAAHCDPERYGEVQLFKFSDQTQTAGPNQMEASFDQDPVVADINRQFNNDQSEIRWGNLLVMPLGSSILYVKPMFLQSRTQGVTPIPELRKVILALQGKIVVGDTYEQALAKLFAEESTPRRPAVTQQQPPTPALPGSPIEGVREAARLLDDADAALRSGDFARYGELQGQAREALRRLLPAEVPATP